MPFVLNGVTIKLRDDYLAKGERGRLNLSVRKDIKDDIIKLSKHINRPVSVMFDVWVEMLQDNPELLQEFLLRVKKY